MHSWMAVYIPYSTGLRSGLLGGLMSGVKSRVLCHSSLVLLCMRGALESRSHQQLDRWLTATVWAARHHSNSPMHHSLSPLAARKPHQCTSAWRHQLKPKHRNCCLSETSAICLWAEMASDSDWNMVSNHQSFIDQSIDQWRDCFTACLKAKSKHFEHVLWCVSLWYVNVMIFKAYTTAAMNKLTYVLFHKVGWKQPSGEVVNFVAVLLQIY